MLEKHREHRSHAAREGTSIFRQSLEIRARLVMGHQHKGAAGIEHRLDRAAQGVLVEQRQRDQAAVALG